MAIVGHPPEGVCGGETNAPAQASLERGTLEIILLKSMGYLGHPPVSRLFHKQDQGS